MNVEIKKDNVRLDAYLKDELGISRSKVQKLIDQGKILWNGKAVMASNKLPVGSVVVVDSELDFAPTVEAENIPLSILFEDAFLMVIDKPSGMVVHPAPGNDTGTLVNALLFHWQIDQVRENLRPGIVHRLDKDTSGVMMVAKTSEMLDVLSHMIRDKEVERIYLALVDGLILHDTGTIDCPIGRDPNDRLKMKVTDENSKPAITHFKVLKRFPKNNKTLILCQLDTGRTHQIRVHMAYIGYPIYNDPLYGKQKKTTAFGQFLHSKKISFAHPKTKEHLTFEAPLPEEFQSYLDELEREE